MLSVDASPRVIHLAGRGVTTDVHPEMLHLLQARHAPNWRPLSQFPMLLRSWAACQLTLSSLIVAANLFSPILAADGVIFIPDGLHARLT